MKVNKFIIIIIIIILLLLSLIIIIIIINVLSAIKCYCQRKPGRSKRWRSAFDLHLFTIGKPPEKIINGGIFRSWWVFLFEDKNFLETRAFHGREISWFSANFCWTYMK